MQKNPNLEAFNTQYTEYRYETEVADDDAIITGQLANEVEVFAEYLERQDAVLA